MSPIATSTPTNSLRRLLSVAAIAALVVGCANVKPSTPPASVGSTPAASLTPTTSAPSIDPSLQPTGTPQPGQSASPGTPARTPIQSSEPSTQPTPSGPPPTPGEFDPDAISLGVEPFASGFRSLTFVTTAGDGTGLLYALEQPGEIRLINPDGSVVAEPFLDIGQRVEAGGEQGLLGLAFHPDFANNGRFFVDYTNNRGDTMVSEFIRAADGSVDATAERVLLTVKQPFSNHNGGMLAFGPDGYLYISLGDGGSGGDPHGNGQNRNVLLGKILRIDVDSGDPYGIPADNPFAGGGGAPEIWDYGLRNPWRFSFDRLTGDLIIADVGQNEWEEVNVEPAGKGGRNYGWNIMEGTHCYSSGGCSRNGLTEPVVTYSHQQGCSVTGGYVYRGFGLPQLYGGYVYADYCSGRLWAFDAAAALRRGSVSATDMGRLPFAVSSFGQDDAGELFVVDHSGAIYRLVATPR